MITSLLSIIKAELKQVFTTPAVLSCIVVAIVLYFFFYPQPYLNEVTRKVPIAVIDYDHTSSSHEFIRKLNTTDGLNVIANINQLDEGKQLLRNSDIYGLVLIPHDFENSLLGGVRSAKIVFFGDASYMLVYSAAAEAVSAVVQKTSNDILVERQIASGVDPSVAQENALPYNIEMIPLFNPESGYATYIIPPVFILILYQTLLLGVMLSCFYSKSLSTNHFVKMDKSNNLSKAVLLVIGKSLTYLMLYTISLIIYVDFAAKFYHFPRLGDLSSTLLVGLPFILATSLLGNALSFLMRREDDAFLLMLPLSMVLFFLSGLSWPKEMMSPVLHFLSMLTPAPSAMVGMVKINQMGGKITDVVQQLYVLWGLVFIYGTVTVWLQYRYLRLSAYPSSFK
ncbi:ABC transporter permease [Serratia sp. S1B]|nr:ABC transporter permease [Serratia sp. S1B]